MSYRVLCFVAVCSVAAFAWAENPTAGNAEGDLQGTWQAIAGEGNGEKLPNDQVQALRFVIDGDKLLVIKPEGERQELTFKLDSRQTPNAINLTPLDGTRKDCPVQGIYALKNGQLKMCINIWGPDPTRRPTEFKTHEGDGVAFITFERTKTN